VIYGFYVWGGGLQDRSAGVVRSGLGPYSHGIIVISRMAMGGGFILLCVCCPVWAVNCGELLFSGRAVGPCGGVTTCRAGGIVLSICMILRDTGGGLSWLTSGM